MEGWTFFTLRRNATKEANVLAAWEESLKRGGSCGVHQQAVASSPWSISQGHHCLHAKVSTEAYNTVQFINGLVLGYQTNFLFVNGMCVYVCVCVFVCELDCNSDGFKCVLGCIAYCWEGQTTRKMNL